jgi:hypothetical protein
MRERFAGKQVRHYFRAMIILAAALLMAISAYGMQATGTAAGQKKRSTTPAGSARQHKAGSSAKAAGKSSGDADSAEFQALVPEFAKLLEKFQGIQFPPLRYQSKLLPLLPSTSAVYVTTPNLGDALHQAQLIFHQQLQESPKLREWWEQKVVKESKGISIDDAVEKMHQLSEYLGNEIVVSVNMRGKKDDSAALMLAEIQKPGLETFIRNMVTQYGGKDTSNIQIFNPQQLQAVKAPIDKAPDQMLVLVRPDFLVVSSDLASLKSFNSDLDHGGGKFDSSPFGQRMAQRYQNGAGMLAGVDVQKFLSARPHGTDKSEMMFEQSGFNDVQYAIFERKDVAGQGADTRTEVTFNGPRRGIASWLGAPGPMGGLDFVSPTTTMTASVLLKSPAQIFDDVLAIASANSPNATQNLEQMQAMLNVRLKEDLLSKLTGEITVAMDLPAQPAGGSDGAMQATPWTVLLKTNDPDGLQKTIQTLVETSGMPLANQVVDGQTYYTIGAAAAPKPFMVSFTTVDGYMVIGPSRERVTQAVQFHKNGKSFAKSGAMEATLHQPANSLSAFMYNSMASPFMAQIMQQLSPGTGSEVPLGSSPMAGWLRGEPASISAGTTNQGFEMTTALLVAAIAIPNLMRARSSANNVAAAAVLRTVNVAQVTYATTYPKQNYAPDMATLGPGAKEKCGTPSAQHACLLEGTMAQPQCTSGAWCAKDAFRYSVSGVCNKGACADYVVVATPVKKGAGMKNFCSTSDAVVRSQEGPPLTAPVSVAECQSWNPL